MPACTYSEFCHIFYVYSTEASLFEVEQLSNSNVALKAPNGKYVTIKMTGALNCSSDACGDKEKFRVCDFDDWVFLTTLHLVLFLCQHLLVCIWSCFFLAGHVGVGYQFLTLLSAEHTCQTMLYYVCNTHGANYY